MAEAMLIAAASAIMAALAKFFAELLVGWLTTVVAAQ